MCGVLVITGLIYNIDGYPLLNPDEGRNAEIAREMAETNDFVLPQLNGLPYLDKPVLYFAADALSIKMFGASELATRLPSLLFTLMTTGLIFWFGLRELGLAGGATAAVATAASPMTLGLARTVIFDSALTFFVLLAIISFYESFKAARDDKSELAYRWTIVAWAAMAGAVLTKGPIGLAIPLMVALPYAAWCKRWRPVGNTVGLLLFVSLLLPWIVAVSRRVPDFLQYALVDETLLRLTTTEFHRTGPLWYFIPILLAASLPWSAVALGGWRSASPLRKDPRRNSLAVYSLIWIAIPLIFFSLSQSKRPHYILPLLPAVALLVATMWRTTDKNTPGVRTASVVLAILGSLFIAANRTIATAFGASALVAAAIPAVGVSLGVICLLAAVAAWIYSASRPIALLALSVPALAIPFVSSDLMRAIGRERSSSDLAAAVIAEATPETEIVGIEAYPLGLSFYLGKLIILATSTGGELTSNYVTRHIERWRGSNNSALLNAHAWRELLADCNRPRIFLVRANDSENQNLLRQRLVLLAANNRYAAYGPCGVTQLATAQEVRRTAAHMPTF